MTRQRPTPEPRICANCGRHWLQQDGKPPRTYCCTTCRQETEGLPAGALRAAVDVPRVPTQIRRIRAQVVTLTCAWCHRLAEVEHFPGPLPRYCSDGCRTEAQRDGAAERMRRLRQRRARSVPVALP